MFISVTQQRVLFSEVEGLCWYHLKGHFFQSLKVFCLFLFIFGMLFVYYYFRVFPLLEGLLFIYVVIVFFIIS